MTTPTGTIGALDVNVELGRGSTAYFSLGDAGVRGLAGNGGGYIDFNSLRGRSSYTPMSPVGYDYAYDTEGGTGTQYPLITYPTVSVTGGSGGYNYNWVFVSGLAGTVVTNNSSNPGIRYVIGKFGTSFTTTYRCDITDSTSHTVSINVTITLT